jgi:predicted nuclease of predicted toxin-antitoxin system
MQNTLFKILIDNNLSVLVKEVLKVSFSDSRHVTELQMSDVSDSDIWQYAK